LRLRPDPLADRPRTFGECINGQPMTSKHTIPDKSRWDTGLPGPLRDRHATAAELESATVALVGLLLGGRSPAAVARLIVAVVVYAVDAVPGAGTVAHVGDEIDEAGRAEPAVADSYAAPAVAGIRRGVRVATPGLYARPDFVEPGVRATVGSVSADKVVTPTPATFGQATPKIDGENPDFFSAIAVAEPYASASLATQTVLVSDGYQAVKAEPGQVFECWHIASIREVGRDFQRGVYFTSA
jgi:hypothetical protein